MPFLGTPQIAFITFCVAIFLFIITYWKSRLRGIEVVSNHIFDMFLPSVSLATAIGLTFAVAVASLTPAWLVDPQASLYSTGMFGALVLLIWTFSVFLRQIALLRSRAQQTSGSQILASQRMVTATAITPTVKESPVAPSLVEIMRDFPDLRVGQIVVGWLRNKLPDFRNLVVDTYTLGVMNGKDRQWEVKGVVQDSILLPYRFCIRGDEETGNIDEENSYFK